MSKRAVHHEKALGNNLKLTTNKRRQLRGPQSDSPLPPAQLINMSAYYVIRRVKKGKRNREPLIQFRDLRADHSIRKSAMEKKDSRILAIASRKIVVAQACYHRTCYEGYHD